MRLNLGSIELDTKGLPRIFSMHTYSDLVERCVSVSILLYSEERAAVAKWAKRMGVDVAICEPHQLSLSDSWRQVVEAVREAEGFRLRVWTSFDIAAPAPVAL